MRCDYVAPQLSQCVDGGDDMFVAATPSNNVDNTILTYCTEYTHSYVICSVNALVNRPGGGGDVHIPLW